jgi:glycine oxidase
VPTPASADLIVVGGGVIGTAIAWRMAQAGRTVTLIDPGTDDKASLVAAGMLGPVSESVFGEQDLLALNLHAIDRFPSFNAELEAAAGQRTGLRTEGTLAVAYDSDDLAALDRLTEFRHSIGLRAERLDAKACRGLEPFLAPSTRGGVLAPGDLSVDNRRYLAALREAARGDGVKQLTGTVTAVETAAGRSGVHAHLTDKSEISAANVVIAAGWAAGQITGVPAGIRQAIRPVKGQILRLRHPGKLPHIIGHTVRAIVGGRDIYLVPREDGELVVGATQEERDDRDITAGAVHDLLRDAMTAVPAISELILAEASAGRRPGTSDNGPILGPIGTQGLFIAAGHFRNGVLLSAVTADAATALLTGGEPHQAWAPFKPGRFA